MYLSVSEGIAQHLAEKRRDSAAQQYWLYGNLDGQYLGLAIEIWPLCSSIGILRNFCFHLFPIKSIASGIF